MDSKLKSLKVVDLKDILSKANVALSGKANKPDLIAKILASPEAIEVYNQNYGPAPDTPAQNASAAPQNTEAPQPQPPKPTAPSPTSPNVKATAPPAPSSKPASKAAPKPDNAAAAAKPSETQTPATADAKKTAEDEEAEKRKARAARFGIPLVEPTVANGKSPGKGAGKGDGKVAGKVAGKVKGALVAEDPEKLAARAARFGIAPPTEDKAPKSNGKKRRSAEPADEEELARRKKRAERFAGTA